MIGRFIANEEATLIGPSRKYVLLAVVFEFGLGLLALLAGACLGISPVIGVASEMTDPGRLSSVIAWGVVAVLPMLTLPALIEFVHWTPLQKLKEDALRLALSMFSEATTLELALVATAAGVGEELLFRGLMLDGICVTLDSERGTWLALSVSSMAFGLVHWISRTYFLLASAMGLYLGGLMLMTKSLICPIIAHSLYDFLVLLYVVKSGRQAIPKYSGGPIHSEIEPPPDYQNHDRGNER